MARLPCIVCGRRPHDGAYHDRWRELHRRWAHLLERRYPMLRGATLVAPPSKVGVDRPKKARPTDVVVRRRALVRGSETEEARRGYRPRGWRSLTERLPGTLAWANRQRTLATEARLLEFGRAVREVT